MKLLHVVPTYLPATRYGGPIYSVHGLCKALVAQGHEVDVVTTSVDGSGNSPVPHGVPVELDGVTVFYFQSSWLRRLYFSPSLIRWLWRHSASYDLVHLHSVFLWPTLAAARSASRSHVPYVVSPRGMLVRELLYRKSTLIKRAWLSVFEHRTLREACAIHFTSNVERDAYVDLGLPIQREIVLANGIDVDECSLPVETKLNSKKLVLFLGRVNWKKGLDRLVRAMAQVPEARLLIVGNDEENYTPTLQHLAREHQVDNRVTFMGFVDGEAKLRLLRSASVMVLPSYSENFGNVVLEAWAEGCPVVVTPEVGLAATVEQEGAGLVSSGDPTLLAGAIRRLLEDGTLRSSCIAAGQQVVRRDFGWDRIAAEMEQHYTKLLAAQ